MRVYEFAKTVGIPTADAMKAMRPFMFIKSHSSDLTKMIASEQGISIQEIMVTLSTLKYIALGCTEFLARENSGRHVDYARPLSMYPARFNGRRTL